MLEIKCAGCHNNCCQHPQLTPVFLPSEEEHYKEVSEKVQTPYRTMHILKKINLNCIFLNPINKSCSNYTERPIECRIYPFVLDLTHSIPDVSLDRRFCPNLKSLRFNAPELRVLVRSQALPFDWVMGYKSLQNC